jgi:hypothetical protein
MRARAIWCALSYGLRPWWMYEGSSHYAPLTYRQHVRMNLGVAWRWITRRETAEDIAFEREVNGSQPPAEPAPAVHVQVHLDGRQIATHVATAVADATARS